MPDAGDLVLHSCGGRARAWLSAGATASCTCGSAIGPDQVLRDGHAWLECRHCRTTVGLCLGFDPVAEAENLMASEPVLV